MNKYISINDAKFYERVNLLSAEGCGPCVKLRVKREYAKRSRLLIHEKAIFAESCCRYLEERNNEIAYLINMINGRFWNSRLIRESNFQSHRTGLVSEII